MENHEKSKGSSPSRRALIYLRSAASNEGDIIRQEEACQHYLKQRNYTFTASIKDSGCSGLQWKTWPGLARVLEMCEAGAIDVLICSRLDRLSRDPAGLLELVSRLKRAGIELETVEEGDVLAQPAILQGFEFLAQYMHKDVGIYLRSSQGRRRGHSRKKPERPATRENPRLFEE